ncbi:MAG: hypothetical protein WC027_00670 [Candidatus Paceibacterota bacterium]
MKKGMIFGLGNIGSTLRRNISKEKIEIKYIVRSDGVFDFGLNKISEKENWKNFIDDIDVAFVCIPTIGKGEEALKYSLALLEKRKSVITCEKASIAYHWDTLRQYKNILRYTASVGGGTKMLKEISRYKSKDIVNIKGVVNGTLNYISCNLKNGNSVEETVKEVLEKGFAEPGAKTLEEIIKAEMNDVVLKTIIIANHSGLFDKIITRENVEVILSTQKDLISKRCIIDLNKEKIRCGFIEDTKADWLPDGVDNILYINGEKKAFGLGAGAEATVESMLGDFCDCILK